VPKPLPVLDPVPDAAECCTPLGEGAISAAEAEQLAVRVKALADPARLRLLSLIQAAEGDEACTCELTGAVGLSQPTVSHHLRRLAEAGLVTGERRGRWTYYRVVPEAMASLARVLSGD
jgi:ArsR family transcriptional regulator